MNKTLQHQISAFITGQNDLQPELMDLFMMISQTYDYYESKLIHGTSQSSSGEDRALPGQACAMI